MNTEFDYSNKEHKFFLDKLFTLVFPNVTFEEVKIF